MCRCSNRHFDCVVYYYWSTLSCTYYSGSPAFLTNLTMPVIHHHHHQAPTLAR
ncbi:hypothetical protein BKA93DRAFT_798604 [Sparassis latifolia]